VARSRNIKPGFFTNADLSDCDPLAHLLFAGLWVLADKAGRLRDRPKQIKGEIMPHRECDVDQLLDQLATVDEPFIHRYEVESVRYIQIVNWEKHQSPHHTEKDSVIPPFVNGVLTVRARRALNQESGINEEGILNQGSADKSGESKLPELPAALNSPRLRQALGEWLEYKGKSLKPRALKALVTRLERRAVDHGVDAVTDALESAMANGWKGWDFDSAFEGKTAKPVSRVVTPDEFAEMQAKGFNLQNGWGAGK
jgi:hypothetical protein